MNLSICIPTYNRKALLSRLLESISEYKGSDVEIVVVDDGSTDGSREVVEAFQQEKKNFTVRYAYQSNSGVSRAMVTAYGLATGIYSMKMDSDDYFLPGALSRLMVHLRDLRLETMEREKIAGLIFGVRIVDGQKNSVNLPPDARANFISLRADYGLSGDLKEVVLTEIIRRYIYDVPENCRRVPPSLLWSRIAEDYDCIGMSEALVAKEYHIGGVSDRILMLKTRNAEPMLELYSLLDQSFRYKSRLYRWRVAILKHRYAIHSGRAITRSLRDFLFLPLGGFLYMSDQLRLMMMKRWQLK